MACTLSARGRDFDVESFLSRTRLPLKRAHFWVRGTPTMRRLKPRRYQDSGFSEYVSRAGWYDLSAAIKDVLKFLRAHNKELGKLKRTRGVDDIMLDFGFDSRVGTEGIAVQGEYLPVELLRLAGQLNIGIGLSLYPPMLEPRTTKRKVATKTSRRHGNKNEAKK